MILLNLKKLALFVRNFVEKNKILILGIFGAGLVGDILINPKISDWVALILIALWIINIFNLRLNPIYSLILAVFSYFISFITQFLGSEIVVEKGASWFFVFLTIALIQRIFEEFGKSERKV